MMLALVVLLVLVLVLLDLAGDALLGGGAGCGAGTESSRSYSRKGPFYCIPLSVVGGMLACCLPDVTAACYSMLCPGWRG